MRSREPQYYLVKHPDAWPKDEADEVFALRALRDMGVLTIPAVGDPTIKETYLWDVLQRGLLRAVVLDADGRPHDLEPRCWKGESGVKILMTGRASIDGPKLAGSFAWRTDGFVYFLREALAQGSTSQDPAPPIAPPAAADWHPRADQTMIDWAASKVAEEAAERRLKAAGKVISTRSVAAGLKAMGLEVGRDFNSDSIHRSRRARASKKKRGGSPASPP